MRKWIVAFCLFTAGIFGQELCRISNWSAPKYCGGFFSDVSFLALTVDPNNLHAVVQEVDPCYESKLPCGNLNVSSSYFYDNPKVNSVLEICTIKRSLRNDG